MTDTPRCDPPNYENLAAWTDVELHSFISGKVGALEVALLAIRALPVPEEMQK